MSTIPQSVTQKNLTYDTRRPAIRSSAFRGELPPQTIEEHEHDEIQLAVGDNTCGIKASWHRSNGKQGRIFMKSGEVAVIPSGQPHSFQLSSTTLVSSVYFDRSKVTDALDTIGDGILKDIRPGYGIGDPLLRELVVGLSNETMCGFRNGRSFAETLEQALLLRVLAGPQPLAGKEPDLPTKRLSSVLDYIDAHFAEDISLDDLAGPAAMSRFHFARRFKQVTGLSPHRYITTRRIEEAKRLLKSDLPIATLAVMLGFADQSHFSSRFKAFVGTSPSAFRKEQ
ncbi:AraC family transcriptional regulator [Ruegeria sp. EL01]|uniref:AraC family transcriptional regulator n=1 Tax=Ruegeria sp. EL01 TaxID=2107578 RepID=UPI0013C40DCE|nr:AraC family transcriptional regulator [Ruegeria sp. EL01]